MKRVRNAGARALSAVFLAIYAIASIYPFAWLVSGAFKTPREAVSSGSLIPSEWTFEGVVAAWSALNFQVYFLNSVIVTTSSIAIAFLLYPLAAFAFSIYEFPLKRPLFYLFIGLLFVPSIVTLLPVILLQAQLGILGTHFGLALVFGTSAGPLAVVLFKTIFDAIPKELREAATLDGASDLWIFLRIYVPLGRAAFATVGILMFVSIWNEYVVTGISLSDESLFTLPVALQKLATGNVVSWNEVMAGSLILVVPVIVLYLFTRRYFDRGLAGAVKG